MLETRNFSLAFTQYQMGLRRRRLQVISDLSLDVAAGEIVAVVGSSGSGKSLLAHAILGILPSNATVTGDLRFDGEPLTAERQARLRGRDLTLVPQSITFLDPLMPVGKQASIAPSSGAAAAESAARQRAVFSRYGLAEHVDQLYPHQLSGGMLRRVLVSTAVLSGARLIIADEPTPGLDPASVAETLQHLRELADAGAAVILITHDLMAARTVADRIAVFYAGTTLEVAPVSAFEGTGGVLRHPYSRALWQAMPENGFTPVPGAQPMPDAMPPGCPFEPRCALATAECRSQMPEATGQGAEWARCFHA